MKIFLPLFILLILAVSAFAHEGHEEERAQEAEISSVLSLTTDNFDNVLKEEKTVFAKFYAPWCGHCKSLAPIWEKASKELADMAKVVKVNCDEQRPLCEKHGIQGFPTLKLFRNGIASEYMGGRSMEDFKMFLERMNRPPVTELTAASQLREFTTEHPVSFVLFGKNQQAKAALTQVATQHQAKMDFATYEDKDQATTYARGVDIPTSADAVLMVIREGKPAVFAGPWASEEVSRWASFNQFELVPELGPQTFGDIRALNVPIAMIAVTKDNKDTTIALAKTVAEKVGTQLFFAWIDAQKWDKYLEQNFEVKAADLPAAIITDFGTKMHFNMANIDSEKEMTKFVQKALKELKTNPGHSHEAHSSALLQQIEDLASDHAFALAGATFALGLAAGYALSNFGTQKVSGKSSKRD